MRMQLEIRDDCVLLRETSETSETYKTVLEFGDALNAVMHCEKNGIELEHNADYIGFMLGAFSVGLTEGPDDVEAFAKRVVYALTRTTDDCWQDNVLALAELLKDAASKMSPHR